MTGARPGLAPEKDASAGRGAVSRPRGGGWSHGWQGGGGGKVWGRLATSSSDRRAVPREWRGGRHGRRLVSAEKPTRTRASLAQALYRASRAKVAQLKLIRGASFSGARMHWCFWFSSGRAPIDFKPSPLESHGGDECVGLWKFGKRVLSSRSYEHEVVSCHLLKNQINHFICRHCGKRTLQYGCYLGSMIVNWGQTERRCGGYGCDRSAGAGSGGCSRSADAACHGGCGARDHVGGWSTPVAEL